ncbi:MAG: NUDIX hydrolase [Patescibacteria group bacterium]|nr:NUDIX hydrolase [Patescibacteria group bacterium]
MPKLINQIGQLPDDFDYRCCRLERGGFLSIYSYRLGDRDRRYDMMYRRNCVVVMPVDFARREVYMIEQPRYLRAFVENDDGRKAVEAGPNGDGRDFSIKTEELMTLEFPAGIIDKGETKEQAAIRELREETGLIVTEDALEEAAGYYTSVGGSTEHITAFIARVDGNTETEQPVGDGHELIKTWLMSWDEAFGLLNAGKIKTASCNLLMRELKLRDVH